MALYNSVWALVLLPLAAAVVSFIAETPRRAAQVCWVGSVLAFLLSALVLGARLTHPLQPPFQSLLTFFAMSPAESGVFANRFSPQIGVSVDSLGASFGFVWAFVVAAVQGYALTTLRTEAGSRRFFWASSLLSFATLGLVFSPNLFDALLMWSLGSVGVYLVAAFWWERSDAAAPARRAFLALYSADIALLLLVAFVFVKFGAYAAAQTPSGTQTALDPFGFGQLTPLAGSVLHGLVPGAGLRALAVMAAIVMFAGVVRAAQVPFHVWLTGTTTSPVPSIALVFGSAALTGVLLPAKAFPLLLAPFHATAALALTGAVTALLAAVTCLAQRDILRVAVLSGIADLGLALAALGSGGYGPALFVLFTTLLFTLLVVMAAGNLVRAYRTRDIHEMGGARTRMRTTSAALVVWAGGAAGLSLATYYALSSVFANTPALGRSLGGATRVAVALLVAVAAVVIAAAAVRVLVHVLLGAPQRRRGFQPERVAEVEPSPRFATRAGVVGAALSVLAGLPGIGPVHAGGLSIPGLTFTRFVYEYLRPTLPVDGLALVVCLAAGAIGAAAAAYALAPGRRAATSALIERTEPLALIVTRGFELERVAHRLGAPFMAAGAFVSRFDEQITETLSDLAAQGSDAGSALVSRLRSARSPIYLAGGLTVVALIALLSILAATGHLGVNPL